MTFAEWSRRPLDSPLGIILLRPMAESDVEAQVSYLYDSPTEYLERIGFDPGKFPGREISAANIRKGLQADREKSSFRVIVAELAGRTTAAVNLPLREVPPDVPRAHFHIFEPSLRGLGLGAPILKNGLAILFREHRLPKVYIEPKVENHPMNRILQKCGFRDLGSCVYSGPATQSFDARRYEVLPEMLD